jgi:transketolase
MREAFVDKLAEEAAKNPDIVLITGDLGYGVLDKFSSNFANQFINAGINEQTMMGMAAGYASTGKKVFVYSIGNNRHIEIQIMGFQFLSVVCKSGVTFRKC